MADNTTLNNGTGGDTVRSIDRSGNRTPILAKTQVVVLDVGGEANESLVSPSNPMPVAIQGANGDDLNDVNLLEALIRGDLALNVVITNQPKTDANGALLVSDCPAAVRILTTGVGQAITIDTQGYATLSISTGTLAANITGCNDLAGTFGTVFGFTAAGTSGVSALAANTNYLIPCFARYIRLTVTTAGWATYYLRSLGSGAGNLAAAPVNIADVAGTAVSSTTGVPVNVASFGGTANAAQAGFVAIGSSAASNGQTLGTLVSTATPAATVVKGTAGKLMSISVGNPASGAVYFKLFNAASVTLGTTSATQSYLVPAGGTLVLDINDAGLYFSTGIVFAVTGGQSLTDNTAITTGCSVNYAYI